LRLPLRDSAVPSACSGDSSVPSSPRRSPVSVRRLLLGPILLLVATLCCSWLSVPIRPPVETSRLGDTSNVVTSSLGDISNVAAWGHYQSRATYITDVCGSRRLPVPSCGGASARWNYEPVSAG